MKKISIGILGFGVVGRGTVETLIARQEEVMLKADIEVDIKKICDKSIPSEIPFGLSAEVFTDNAEDLLEDDEISVLVEMIGGVGFSKDFIEKALKKGKHVITANKHLIAKFGNEFFSLAQENNVLLLIEASTAGAIPCIRALRKSLVSLDIKAVKGVLNGTCNFILTRLQNEGGDYADVLRQAQELGYAEADPTFDVEGIDSAHKTAILGAFAFGGEIDFENVKIKGISDLITDDFRFADEIDCNIKLIGSAVKKDGKVYMSVLPTLVKKTSKLGQVHGVMNAVLFEDEFSGPIMMEGHGAGGRATGTAVAADIIEACKHAAKDEPKNRSLPYNQIRKIKSGDFFDLEMKSVMRVVTDNKAGVLAKLAQVLADKGVSLFGVSHKPNFEEIVAISLLLDRCPLKLVEEASKEISKLDFVKSEPLILPIDESE